MVGIYKITSPSGRIYIGESINIEARWKDYKNLSNCKSQSKLYNSFKKYKVENHSFEVIEECTFGELLCKERYWQDFYDVLNGGLNCRLTKCEELKQIVSDSTRKKLSNALKGKSPSEEHRKNLSRATKGRKGMVGKDNPRYGKKLDVLIIEKTRAKNIEKYNNFTHGKGKIVLCLDTGIFYTVKEASEVFTINYSTLHSMLNGSRINKTNLIFC